MENIDSYQYKKAKKHVEEIKSFYGHLMVYLIVIPILAIANYRTVDFPWVIFPAVGWGMGLLGHWLGVFGYCNFFGKSWEERKIKELLKNNEF